MYEYTRQTSFVRGTCRKIPHKHSFYSSQLAPHIHTRTFAIGNDCVYLRFDGYCGAFSSSSSPDFIHRIFFLLVSYSLNVRHMFFSLSAR